MTAAVSLLCLVVGTGCFWGTNYIEREGHI